MFVKPEIERFAKIRVVGIGGAGCNIINTMIESQQINGVEFIAINTDAQDLSISKAVVKIPIGQALTNGLGAGSDPTIGRDSAQESIEQIKSNLEGSDMVFIAAGMGGGTGTGAAPVVAAVAKELGALTIATVTKPFEFEGAHRMENAERGIEQLKSEVDALITIPNQKLLDIADEEMSVIEAFKVSDSVLTQGVQGISDLIVVPGLINVDFADVRSIMKDAGSALMGIGIGTGPERAVTAAKAAISSPLLEVSIDGATGILINITGGMDLSLQEINHAAKIITENASTDANVIFGAHIDQNVSEQIKITVIATGFDTGLGSHMSFRQDYGVSQSTVSVQSPVKHVETPEPVTVTPTKKEEVTPDFDEVDDNYSDDSKYDIPAFLRGRK
ncbi:cell division protein FtsZ [candidate division WWE3 bacterium]|uniref:Cell division protein FtsZ n=1 Tax=candidate division WWE3 bacterium TaxID=2053526 RepID=A0A955EAU3_UNCKA|nr:cell division protein FtsZ [candidate division WWE3 bacterium]